MNEIEASRDELEAIHHLAQPLTALAFVIELGRLQLKPEAWKQSLDTAAEECRRAIAALNAVRHAAAFKAAEGKEDA